MQRESPAHAGEHAGAGTAAERPLHADTPAHAAPGCDAEGLGRPIVIGPALLRVLVVWGAVASAFWALRDLALPLLLACGLALLGARMVDRLEGRGLPRYAGSLLFIVLVLGGVALLALMVVPKLLSQLGDLLTRLPELLERMRDQVERRFGAPFLRELDAVLRAVQASLLDSARSVAGTAARGVGSALGATASGFVVPLIALFLLAELPAVDAFIRTHLPARMVETLYHQGGRVHAALAKLLRGQFIVASILAAIYSVGLSLFGVPMPVAIGVISAFAYFIPFATTPTCLLLSAAFVLLEPDAPHLRPLVGALAVALVVQIVESWVLTPRIVGGKAQLSPLVVVLAVWVGGELLGFSGVLLALPAATILGVFFRERRASRAAPSGDAADHAS